MERLPALARIVPLALLVACQRQNLAHTTFITMADNTFSPSLMRVPVGTHLEFRNWGGVVHNAHAVDGSWTTAAGGRDEVKVGAWVGVTFDRPGVYHFYCKFHGTPDGKHGMVGTIIVGDVNYVADAAKSGQVTPVEQATGVSRRVPEDYPTIQAAVDAAAPGDLVLVAEGTYKEEVIISTPSVTLRGTDRNKVILEGEFQRANGVAVFADAVAVENLTAQNFRLNGVFFTGVKGYRASYVSAMNNGDYGIYAFDAYDGVLDHSLGSGSPDAGFYVGGCYPCRAVLDHVMGVNNIGDGYSGTNSGGDTYLINSVFSGNGVGIGIHTLDVEPHAPERETTVIGNVIANNRTDGLPIVGGNRNLIERNLVTGNGEYGIIVHSTKDRNFYPATGNVIRDNVILGSGKADLALSGIGNLANCFERNAYRSTLPWGVALLQPCRGVRFSVVGDPAALFGQMAQLKMLFGGRDRFGDEWKTWPRPALQPSMPGGAAAPVRPAVKPFAGYPLELDRIKRPSQAW